MCENLIIFPYGQYIESMFHWLSEDVLKFEVDAGVQDQLAKM